MRTRWLIVSTLLLGGCVRFGVQAPISAEPFAKEEGRIGGLTKVLKAGYAACLPSDASDLTKQCSSQQIDAFLDAGMTLSDIRCDSFLRYANSSARRRQYGRGLFNDVGGGVQAVLGLAKVASGVVGGVGAGVSAIDSTFRNYDTSFMVDADLAKLRRLVLAAQDRMLFDIRSSQTTNIYAAERRIVRYDGLCTFLGMKGLLDASIEAKTDAIERSNDKERQGGNTDMPQDRAPAPLDPFDLPPPVAPPAAPG